VITMHRLFNSSRVRPFLLLVAITNQPGCVSSHGDLHAQGAVAERAWTAQVDHPIARDYLEGRPLPLDLEEIRAAYLLEGTLPSQETLSHLTTRYSTDVATLFFAETVSAHAPSQGIQREYSGVVQRLMRDGEVPEISRLVAREARPGDVVAILSNGGFGGLHEQILAALGQRGRSPRGRRRDRRGTA
jgi:hypothetical protein